VELLQEDVSLDYRAAFILAQRHISSFDEARRFFRPDIGQLHDPFQMKDMDRAVDRLSEALHKKEKILVYGDYDVDGTTAVTVVFSFLRQLNADCQYYIPDRYTEGYGFSLRGVDFAKDHYA
jgi:single-stranded-DNA-specific exonuclease